MKATLHNIRIFQTDSSTLHIEFSCKNNGSEVTKKIFDKLQKFSLNSKEKQTWYNIYNDLLIKYNPDQNKIEFKEDTSSQPSSLTLLPSLLLRDWDVIDNIQKELLETYFENSELMEERKSGEFPAKLY